MATRMQKQVRGKTPTLMSAKQANMLIGLFNAMQSMNVLPSGAGTFTLGEDSATLDLSEALGGGLQAKLQATDLALAAMASQINQIYAALANATIVCNTNGTITLTFPGVQTQPLT